MEALAESGPRSRCTIEAVEYSYHPSPLSQEKLDDLGGYYDANFVSLLAQEWARKKRDLNPLFYKPDGTYSRVRFQVRETP
jgi:hypothetical protein